MITIRMIQISGNNIFKYLTQFNDNSSDDNNITQRSKISKKVLPKPQKRRARRKKSNNCNKHGKSRLSRYLYNELCQNFYRYGSQFEANKGGDQSPSMEDEPDHTERRNLNVSQVKKLPEPRSAYFATNVSPDFRAPS